MNLIKRPANDSSQTAMGTFRRHNFAGTFINKFLTQKNAKIIFLRGEREKFRKLFSVLIILFVSHLQFQFVQANRKREIFGWENINGKFCGPADERHNKRRNFIENSQQTGKRFEMLCKLIALLLVAVGASAVSAQRGECQMLSSIESHSLPDNVFARFSAN